MLSVEVNLSAGSTFSLRLRDPNDDWFLRLDVTPEGLTVSKLLSEPHAVLSKVALQPAPGAWHKLSLKFNGPELYGEMDGKIFIVADSVLERDKSEVNFLVPSGTIGLRNFAVAPVAGEDKPRVSTAAD